MRIMFFGDIVGRSGREAFAAHVPLLRDLHKPDFVIVNGENAAHGFGITHEIFRGLLEAGADAVTLGNHSFDQREALVFIEREPQLVRPLNYPAGTPGRGAGLYQCASGQNILVVNAMGRVWVEPVLDDPFAAIEHELGALKLGRDVDAIFIDFHAQATSEKMAFAHFVDGRVTAVAGTHTHIPTADHTILPGGTAYQTDTGMCGDYDSVIGMDKAEPIRRFVRKLPVERPRPAEGEGTVCGLMIDSDDATGLARAVWPLRVGGRLSAIHADVAIARS